MLRWIVACCAALLLSGCVTYPTYTYDDGREVRYVDDETYYVGAGNGYGDYYARSIHHRRTQSARAAVR